ncbi:LysR family transcriptional regulator [Collimonas pratensis]|uniref:Transcriptional activator protein lysR n=1 Tax=Collimonas pratensis TaxID=279113 RepID=A0A127Q1J6_9BURK|nr:LysR family transcriptional regulator [Collimonas pratensis]AMP03705.1 transcriptional activator protein lysR [Collimonas pratensis]
MSITLRHIEVFRAVMTAGSVTGAASLLRTSQPTVSRELARFESLVQMALFERVRGRLQATTQALALYEEVRRSYVGLERIVSMAGSIRQFEHGQLSVICLPTFAQTLLPAACRRFLDDYPTVGLSITPQESPLLEESLSSQRHDIGITETLAVPTATTQSLLFSGDMVCVLPDGHPLLSKQKLTPGDFAGERFVNLSVFDSYRQQLDEIFVQHETERLMAIETASAASVCAMVRQGLGVAIVNPLTAMDEAGQGLHLRRFSLSVPFHVSLVRPQHRPASMLADAFASVLHKHCLLLAAALKTALRK